MSRDHSPTADRGIGTRASQAPATRAGTTRDSSRGGKAVTSTPTQNRSAHGAARGSTPHAVADRTAIAGALGALNAAHASPRARDVAAANSRVGRIAAYENAMRDALAMPEATQAQRAAKADAIAAARTHELAAAANKPISPDVVTRVDSLLGLPPSDPTLGVTR